MSDIFTAAYIVFLFYFVLYGLCYGVLLLLAWRQNAVHTIRIRASHFENLIQGLGAPLPPISLLVPAYNECDSIVNSIKSLLNSNYPVFEVIVINDGSTDTTLYEITQAFDLRPTSRPPLFQTPCKPIKGVYVSGLYSNVIVVDKENGGRADALNAGLNFARFHLVARVDADSVVERDSLLRCVRPFIDPRTIAAGGVVRILNGCKIEDGKVREIGLPDNPLVIMQAIEYTRAFFVMRPATDEWNAVPLISGTFGLYRRDIVVDLGGFDPRTVGEDMELIMRLHEQYSIERREYRIAFVADPVAWTEAPATLRGLARQRARWHRGLAEVLWQYRHMLFNPRYGAVGMFVLPFYWLFELLEPVFLLAGYLFIILGIITGHASFSILFSFLVLNVGLNLIISSLALFYGETRFTRYQNPNDVIYMAIWSATEPLWYRWLTVIWRSQGLFSALKNEILRGGAS